MKTEKILELEKKYNFSIEALSQKIKKSRKKSVLLQFPDGLKPYSLEIADYLKTDNDKLEIKIWLGSCFGACDIPQTKSLLVQFGHSPWKN